jgi:L-asparaginase II
MKGYQEAVHVVRGEIVESIHAAAVAVVSSDGDLVKVLGHTDFPVFLRSVAKPFQASAVLASGAARKYGFSPREIALISGSHAGDPEHQETAASILKKAGLGPDALQCGIHIPFSKTVAARLAREGLKPTPLMNNCSGKHAGMLAAAASGSHGLDDYLEAEHPVQQSNLAAIAKFTGRDPGEIRTAVDGCSAPTFSVTLADTARAFARLAAPAGEGGEDPLMDASKEVVSALRAHPEMIAGEGMLDTLLMKAVPGLIAKVGADGMHAMAWLSPEGPLGIAIKVMDGHVGRPRTAVVLEVLRQLGALAGGNLPDSLAALAEIRNHRRKLVGELRPVFTLSRPN